MADQKITAWSFSRYNDYEKCPYYAKLKFIDKLREPDNPAQKKGSDIHKAAELYVKGQTKTLDPALKNFKAEFNKLVRLKAQAEGQWAFNPKWEPVDWFAKDAWCRIKIDACCVSDGKLFVIDYKTGKIYPNHAEQLELYAIGGFLQNTHKGAPDVLEAQDWYLDLPEDDPQSIGGEEFDRADVKDLQKKWASKTKAMLTDTRFLHKPGPHCNRCHFRKGNNGPCKY